MSFENAHREEYRAKIAYATKITCGDAPSYEINTAIIVLPELETMERRATILHASDSF